MPHLPHTLRRPHQTNLHIGALAEKVSRHHQPKPRRSPTSLFATPRPSPAHVSNTHRALPPRHDSPASQHLSMASDEDYMAFLNKANEDLSSASGQATTQGSKVQSKTVDEGTEVPRDIQEVCRGTFYVSEADEPFEGVSLRWNGEGGLPDDVEFAKLINHPQPDNADVSILDPLDWDSKGQYVNVLQAVRQASGGNDVRVYKVPRDRTRVEYWLVTREEGRIVGAKALSVES